MALATWWRGDPLPPLPKLDNFFAEKSDKEPILARLTGLDTNEIRARLQAGHRPYLGYLAGEPVAYGWLATHQAAIGELGLDFNLPARHRYLWDFATLPAWRGRGIYPHLLQAILQNQIQQADYFWIIYAPENRPSGAGIRKAGFSTVGLLSLHRTGRPGLTPQGDKKRAGAGADLLGVPLLVNGLSPCWHCGGAAYPAPPHSITCSCGSTFKPVMLPRQASCLCVAA